MNKILKTMKTLLATMLVVGLVGCGSQSGSDFSGKISLAGSTSMEKVCESLMEGFMEMYPDITVTTE